MNNVTEFRVGHLYTNDQIRFALAVENLGGIRPSLRNDKALRHIAVLTTAETTSRNIGENPYRDRIEGDVLTYTAQGKEGDQLLTGRNKRLLEQYQAPIPLFGFINVGQQTYRFLGLLELLRHSQELQVDRRRTLRKVWLFEFRIHHECDLVPISESLSLTASLLVKSRAANPLTDLERVVESAMPDEQVAETRETVELRTALLDIDPYRFEKLIKVMMERNGFVNVTVTPRSADGGIDVNAYAAEENAFFAGCHVQVQAKRWRHAVGGVEMNHFRGALSTTARGLFVTTSHYTRAAILESRHSHKPSITLIDGPRLVSILHRSSIDLQSVV